MRVSSTPGLSGFAADVMAGLSATPKHLSSKYFYDDEGTRLFQEIMKLPEYYLTACETEIFEKQSREIAQAFANGDRAFDLIELGAGDGTKTAILISNFLNEGIDLSYVPIDISQEALNALKQRFLSELPGLDVKPLLGDYFEILRSLKGVSTRRKVILFLGSNIGNFSRGQSIDFFGHLKREMNPNDLLFTGFDLQKDPHVIVPAYDDARGITAEFNLNLLRRINRELGGDFNLDNFMHYANYRPIEGSARSFLISREDQTVRIEALNKEFHFDQWEAIFMEISQKYSVKLIAELASSSGFRIKHNFIDSRNYYCDSLWTPSD